MKKITGTRCHVYRPETYFHIDRMGEATIIKRGLLRSLVLIDGDGEVRKIRNKWIYASTEED